MNSATKTKLLLLLILLIGGIFRFYGLNWDQGHHLHPDERAIVTAVDKLELAESLPEFFSSSSPWNPEFFAYGSLPMYLLHAAGSALSVFDPAFGTYTSINLAGRFLSALADLITIVLIFKIGRLIFNNKVGLLAAFFYAISTLPIQLSHFFAVDTFLTMLIMLTLYRLLLFYRSPNSKNTALAGVSFGLALASKVSAIVLLAPIGIALLLNHQPSISKRIKNSSKHGLLIISSAFATFVFFMPYALIDFQNFWQQTVVQSQLTNDPFYFPYTLQFVGKIPYWYELKNIFLWGLGPIVATLAFVGSIYLFLNLIRSFKIHGKPHITKSNNLTINQFNNELVVLFMFFAIYSLIVGNFAVGFMRYMLPAYPILALFAAIFAFKINNTLTVRIKNIFILNTLYLILYALLLVWPLSFVQIYSRPNTRVQASEWIYSNIDPTKTLAVEHWDDQLPIGGTVNYQTQILKLYDPDTEHKWQEIEAQLAVSDYIIIASNRLYAPLQKLTNCEKLPMHRCYPRTAGYYKKLFAGEQRFKKVAEFTSFPTVPVLNIPINDQSADENFTVFDHPKVMIFQKK